MNANEINIRNDLNYIESMEERIKELELANFGYWNHVGNNYSIKLTVDEVKELLKNRLTKMQKENEKN